MSGMRFGDHGKRRVLAAFDGGDLTSDAGGVLLRETAERLDLFSRMAACFEDRRKQDQITHTLPSLLAERVTGIALGYEDLTDHDSLRHDPLLKLLGEADLKGNEPLTSLAGSSTLGRMERSFQDNNRRYHKITAQPAHLQDLFVDLFLESHDSPPERITLDIDATDIKTHGNQVGGFFHGYGACPREGGGTQVLPAALCHLRPASAYGETAPWHCRRRQRGQGSDQTDRYAHP